MKKILALLSFFTCFFAQAQKPTNDARGSSTYILDSDTGRSVDIREKLVRLALQNPTYEVADHQVNIAAFQLKVARSSWLGLFAANGNVNEYTISPPKATVVNGQAISNPIYYPRYNFGLTIPLDVFSVKPNNVKIARENYAIAAAQRTEKYRQIKVDVLTRYEDYLLDKQKLEYQIQITQDQYTVYKKAEKDYADGSIKLEDLNKSYKGWVDEQTRRLEFQRNANVAKLELERIIGVKLEDVIKN